MAGTNEQGKLQELFFSTRNTNNIQYIICKKVFHLMDIVIDKQSGPELTIVMHHIFSEHATFTSKHYHELVNEVMRLNNKVVEFAVKNIITNVKQHNGYIRDRERGIQPMNRPQATKQASKMLRKSDEQMLPMLF